MNFFVNLLDVSDFPARWQCGRWSAAHGWLHITSDLAVASAYFAIPLILGYFLLQRGDLPFRRVFLLFAAFILLCGATHLMEASIFWWPAYRLAGLLKLMTAAVSWGTAFALIRVVPDALRMRSPEELERAIAAREAAEKELQRANVELEQRVQRGLAELTAANAALSAEREWFSTTLSSIGDAVITTDIEGRVSSLNGVAEALTGWREDEADGRPLTEVFHIVNQKTRNPAENPALRALKEGSIVGLANHTILVSKDGVERYIDDSAAPIRTERNEVTGAVLVFRDITERYEAEQAARAQHELIETITDNATTAILMIDEAGRCTFMNRAAEGMTGFSFQEAEGRGLHDLIHHTRPDGSPYPTEECAVQQAAAAGAAVRDHEDVFIRKSGERFPVMCNARPARNKNAAVGTVLELRDLSAQKAAEELLRRSEERFKQLADAIPQLVWMARPDGHIDWYNQRWYEYTGATLEDMQGWGWERVHDPKTLPLVLERWNASLAEGSPFEMEFPLRGSDGKFRPFLTRVLPFRDDQGEIVRWFGTNTDISEQKQAQEELRRIASALSEADRRKNEFLAMLGHELRNPLAPIRSGLDWMAEAAYEPEQFEQVRSIMARQTDHLVALVDDLLDISRITSGNLQLRRRSVSLGEVVRHAAEECQPLIDEANQQLDLHLPEEPIELYADPHRLRQSLSNLLKNASLYTPSGGAIFVSAEAQADQAVITVRDTGRGIPQEMLESIFEMFARIPEPDHSNQGLGIGLTLVKRLIEMHSGTVEAQSEGEGRGSVFTIRLPLSAAPSDNAPGSDLERATGKLRVLILDDNRDAAKMLALLVGAMGHETRTFYDGQGAVEAAADFRPQAALIDLGMPGMNGFEVARLLRRQPWGKDVLLVAVSGWGQDEDKRRTEEAGFDVHLIKPVGTAQLTSVLAAKDPSP